MKKTKAKMNTKTLISIKIDKSLKEAARDTAEELGFSLGTVINALLRQFVRDKELNLAVSYKPTPYLKKILAEAEKEIKEGKLGGPFHTVEELMADLES